MPNDPVIVAARRTAVGTAGSAFADVDVIGLAAPLLAEAAGSSTAPTAPAAAHPGSGNTDLSAVGPIDEVILGNCLGPGGNIARVAALAAGLGTGVPGVTVDRQCASGLEAVAQAATLIRAGSARRVLAGGVESASTAPWRSWPPESGGQPRRYRRAPFAPPGFPDPDMGVAADELARDRGITRERLDAYAAGSHRRAFAAAADGRFADEILAVHGVSADQRPRDGMTPERLARLRPAFCPDGTATAGNSCGVSDGAALLTVVADPGDSPGLLIRGVATIGCDPALPGAGAGLAIAKLLADTGIGVDEIGVIEVTEAFATIPITVIDDLRIDPAILCPDGGAIGYGHPWGASGAILLVRLFSRMVRDSGGPAPEFGIAACAVGGGLGMAMLVQRTGFGPS